MISNDNSIANIKHQKANQIKDKMEGSECKRSRRKHFVEGLNRGARYESSQPVCKTQLCSQVM